jgi:hypothetical protein
VARAQRIAPVFALSMALVLAACGSSSGTGSSGSTTATNLILTAKGTPDLKGLTIPLATAGAKPGDEDTLGYIVEKTLQSWGANSSLNLAEAPAGADAVVAGRIDAVNSDMPSLLNLPLEIFMPNQVRLDYEFVSTDVQTLGGLKGKTIDVGTQTSAEYQFMGPLLKYAHLSKSQVKYEITGSASGSSFGTQLITHAADAAWVHVSNVAKIKTEVPHLYVLAKATSVMPSIADSFWAATPAWLKSHPAIAEAICLAWIQAAKTFNDHASTWVNDAEAYTLNADPVSSVQADHATYLGLQLWPVAQSSYTPQVVKQNYNFNAQYNLFSGSGIRSLSKVAVYGPWTAAWQVYEAHPSAY